MRFGTGMGAVLVFRSGGGRGVPGGGKGCPLPMTIGCGVSFASGCPLAFWSACRCRAFHPHFLAVTAAFVTAAKDIRFASTVEDFEEDIEFSRLTSFPNDPNDFADGASELNDALLMLDGLGRYEGSLFESIVASEILREGCGARSLSALFSMFVAFLEDADDWLPDFSGRDGDPTGV